MSGKAQLLNVQQHELSKPKNYSFSFQLRQ